MEQRNPSTEYGMTESERLAAQTRDAGDTVADKARQASEKAGDALQSAADRVKQTASDLRSKDPGELADATKQKTSEVSAAAADKVESAMTATGEGMSNLAQTVRSNAPEGKVGEYAQTAADALDRSGQYLKDADIGMVRSDLERVIREHPIESMLVGLGVGYLLARATRR